MKYKLLFHFCLLLLIATEVWRAYLVLPFPGSQEAPAVETAYFLYHYRWWIRIILFIGLVVGFRKTFEKRKWIPILMLLITGVVYYMANFNMTAETFFQEPAVVEYAAPAEGKIPMDALVIGVTNEGESRAYPIRYLSFHHQVHDTIGGKHLMITYCSVCRSGLVYVPTASTGDGRFRLVGMDQFNAMFEDHETGSWWQQATGECIAGELKGEHMEIFPSEQLTLAEWTERHPDGKVMLPDAASATEYYDETFEKGTTTSSLEYTDTASWKAHSWIVGIERNGMYRAYDWNQLKKQRYINDTLGGDHVVITIDDANVNFTAAVQEQEAPQHVIEGDTVLNVGYHPGFTMRTIQAYQMFWHSWEKFHPQTTRYSAQ